MLPAPMQSIHHVDGYLTTKFTRLPQVPEGYARICLVRDPISRLHSAWKNKVGPVIFKRRGEAQDVIDNDLPLDPSFGEFIENLGDYRLISRPSRVHTEAYSWHLGPDLGWYDKVFQLEKLSLLEQYVSQRAGKPVKTPQRNESGEVARPLDMQHRHIDQLRTLLRDDYALLSGLYDFDRSMEAFVKANKISL